MSKPVQRIAETEIKMLIPIAVILEIISIGTFVVLFKIKRDIETKANDRQMEEKNTHKRKYRNQ